MPKLKAPHAEGYVGRDTLYQKNKAENTATKLSDFEERIALLEERLETISKKVFKVGVPSIQRLEKHNDEVEPVQNYNSLKDFTQEDMIQSIRNSLVILPPNYKVDGRHILENVQALQGSFKVTEELLDLAYEGFKHQEY